jgi:hypothetical protein
MGLIARAAMLGFVATVVAAQGDQPSWPEGVQCARVIGGREDFDHLGIGASAVGDLNGDGVRDYVIGAMFGAYTFSFGPGYVLAISGRDGSVLYRVEGLAEQEGDAFGDTIASLGDFDGDGVADFAVGAWRWGSYSGYVQVFSGRDGRKLERFDGTAGFGGVGRAFVDAGEWSDRQRALWIAINAQRPSRQSPFRTHSELRAAADGALVADIPGIALASPCDVDGDAREDTLAIDYDGSVEAAQRLIDPVELRFGPDRRALLGTEARRVELAFACGDIDRDGVPDVGVLARESWSSTRVDAQVFSAVGGELVWSATIPIAFPAIDTVRASSAGDVDGDGRSDIVISIATRGDPPDFARSSRMLVLGGACGELLSAIDEQPGAFGHSIAPVGDLDRDGRDELLVGAYESQILGRCRGAAFLLSFANR